MGKKSRATSTRTPAGQPSEADGARPGPRQPCYCGSGKRFKACHGASGGAEPMVTRPFAGLQAECQLVAMREFLPSATMTLPLRPGLGEGEGEGEAPEVVLGSVLPTVAAATVIDSGRVLIGAQTQTRSGDVSADLAAAVRWGLSAQPRDVLGTPPRPSSGQPERLQDLLPEAAAPDAAAPELTVHSDFAWWTSEAPAAGSEAEAAMERANAAIEPAEALTVPDASAAFWMVVGEQAFLRWVRPEPEAELENAMARLAADDRLHLGEGTRYVGAFRAHGLLVPVWELDAERHAREWEPALGQLATELQQAMDEGGGELTDAQRRARASLRGREVTLR